MSEVQFDVIGVSANAVDHVYRSIRHPKGQALSSVSGADWSDWYALGLVS